MTERLTRMETRARELGRRIGAPPEAYPQFGRRLDAGYASLEDRDGEWVLEAYERGELCSQNRTRDDETALYWVLRHATRDMASRWELAHRVPGTDSRAGWAGKQLELLAALDPTWPERFRREEASWLDEVRWP